MKYNACLRQFQNLPKLTFLDFFMYTAIDNNVPVNCLQHVKQYLPCTVKWRHSFWCYWRCYGQTLHIICMSKTDCRRCTFVSNSGFLIIFIDINFVLFGNSISCVCLFKFLTKSTDNRRQLSKFWFPPLHFLWQNVLRYNSDMLLRSKYSMFYIDNFMYKHLNTWLWI